MTAPTLLQLPEEILARIVCNTVDTWQVKIRTKTRANPSQIEDSYNEPRSSGATPSPVPFAPLFVCKQLSRIAHYSILDRFSGTISILDTATADIQTLPSKWQPIRSRIKHLIVPSHRLHFLTRNTALIRSLPSLQNIEFVEHLKMYFPIDLNQLDSKGRWVPAEPDEVTDEYLRDLAALHVPAWPVDGADSELLRGIEVVFHANFCFRYRNWSRNYDVAFLVGGDGMVVGVRDRRSIRGG